MYHNGMYLGSPEPRQRSYIYKTSVKHKGRPLRATEPKYYYDNNDIIITDRRHSLESSDNVPVYEKYIRPVMCSTSAYREPPARMERVSYRQFMNGDYVDEQMAEEGEELHQQHPVIDADNVVRNLTAVGRFLEVLQGFPLPRLSLTTACLCFIAVIFISPRPCVQNILFPVFRLSFGTLYPAYASYKAVRTKNVKEYVSLSVFPRNCFLQW